MKNIIFLLFILHCSLFIVHCSFGQTPQAIPYQAVARDSAGNLVASQSISLRFNIRNTTAVGPVIYIETHAAVTNMMGLFTVNIGQGTPVSGTFASVNWSTSAKFLQVEMDAAGGTAYVNMGTQQMLSVPYAFFSGSSAGAAAGDLSVSYPNPTVARINGSPLGATTSATNGQVLKYNGVNWSPSSDNNSGGTVTSITAGTGLSGGTITTAGTINMPNVGTAGTYGSATEVPVITTDAHGRVRNVTTSALSSGWSLSGNNNTMDGTHFIGTTNGVALNLKLTIRNRAE